MSPGGACKVFVPGQGAVSLTAASHVATGGEGALYVKGAYAYKVYLEPERARAAGMLEKLTRLSQIRHPFIVVPDTALLDERHRLIGHRMPAVSGEPLVKTFANAWRQENAFDLAASSALVVNMRAAVAAAHAAGALLVDGNEMNYLVAGAEPRLIDVDSWQIDRWPATAIMPSIRDWRADALTELTDWFAWGIVTFQVFVGIHPYKGSHPSFKRGDLEGRMRANASVFDSAVKLPAAVRPFADIPARLRDWYVGVFQHGERATPPTVFEGRPTAGLTPAMKVRTVAGGGVLRHDLIWQAPGALRFVLPNGIAVAEASGGLTAYDLNRRSALKLPPSADLEHLTKRQALIVRAPDGRYLWTSLADGALTAQEFGAAGDPVAASARGSLPSRAHALRLYGNTAYALDVDSELGLQELAFDRIGNGLVVSVRSSWPVLVQGTRFFPNMAVQNCLGSAVVVVPQEGAVRMHRADCLRGMRVLSGCAARDSVLVLAAEAKSGALWRIWLQVQGDDLQEVGREFAELPTLSAATNARGVLVCISEDGALHVAAGGYRKDIADAGITSEMQLFTLGEGVGYALGHDVYRLSMA